MFEYDRNRVKRMSDYANGLFAEIIEQYRNGIVDNEFVKYAEAISKANHDYIESLCEAAQNELEKELDAKNIAAIEKVVNGTVNEIIKKFTDAFVDEFTKEMEAEEATGAFDPVTDVPGVAELMWKVAEETDDKELKFNICASFIDHGKDITEFPGGVSVDEACENLQKAFEAARVNELESRHYDDELQCNKYSAAEIAQKLNVLSQYCDIDLSGKCDISTLVHFLESVELDTEGNVWLIVQVDEHTFKRFRLNREAAGQITM